MTTSDAVACASLIVSLVALGVSYFAIMRSNKASSAASLISINEAFRNAWKNLLFEKDEKKKEHEFVELANLLEIGCAIAFDHAFTGVPREILCEYLDQNLSLLEGDKWAQDRFDKAITDENTYKYIVLYLKRRRAKRKV